MIEIFLLSLPRLLSSSFTYQAVTGIKTFRANNSTQYHSNLEPVSLTLTEVAMILLVNRSKFDNYPSKNNDMIDSTIHGTDLLSPCENRLKLHTQNSGCKTYTDENFD